jgi:hypothetical protein
MGNRRDDPVRDAQKDFRRLRQSAMRELKRADRDYKDEPSLRLVFLKLLGALIIAAIFLMTWLLVGWWALFIPVFFCLAIRSFLWAVIVPLVVTVLVWIFVL